MGELQRVELEFANGIQENPVLNFEEGSFSIRFRHTILARNIPEIVVPSSSSLIESGHITSTPESNSVRVEILFNPKVKIAPPTILRGDTTLFLELTASAEELPQATSEKSLKPKKDKSLEKEIADKVRQGNTFPFNFQSASEDQNKEQPVSPVQVFQKEDDWTGSLMLSFLSLVLVLSLIFLLAYLYNRFLAGKFPATRGKLSIRMISSFHIAPRQKVVILEINGAYYACGATPNSINLLSQIDHPGDQDFLNDVKLDPQKQEMRLDHSRVDFLKALKAARQHTQETETFPPVEEIRPVETNFPSELADAQSEPEAKPEPETQSENLENASEPTPAFQSPVYPPLEEATKESSFEGNPLMQDFASKLSERVKKLKPIR